MLKKFLSLILILSVSISTIACNKDKKISYDYPVDVEKGEDGIAKSYQFFVNDKKIDFDKDNKATISKAEDYEIYLSPDLFENNNIYVVYANDEYALFNEVALNKDEKNKIGESIYILRYTLHNFNGNSFKLYKIKDSALKKDLDSEKPRIDVLRDYDILEQYEININQD